MSEKYTATGETIAEMKRIGFAFESSTGRFWHWTESPGIEIMEDDLWFPCDMFDTGKIQYSDEGFPDPVEAAKRALQIFT